MLSHLLGDVESQAFARDQVAESFFATSYDAMLKVFVKVVDESRGYFGNDGAVARFEEDLDKRGQYGAFKVAFAKTGGIDWS